MVEISLVEKMMQVQELSLMQNFQKIFFKMEDDQDQKGKTLVVRILDLDRF